MTAPLDDLDADTLRKLSRTEMIRVLDEFKSERDAAKRSAMRAFDERNIALAANATLTAENKALREALRRNALSTIGRPAGTMNLCTICKECGGEWVTDTPERHAPGCLAAGAANER